MLIIDEISTMGGREIALPCVRSDVCVSGSSVDAGPPRCDPRKDHGTSMRPKDPVYVR